MTQRSFEKVSFELANLRFKEWCKELTEIVEESHYEAVEYDKRLCYATKKGIGDRFLLNMKQKGIAREFERERRLRNARLNK
jgi:hypothetical protein